MKRGEREKEMKRDKHIKREREREACPKMSMFDSVLLINMWVY